MKKQGYVPALGYDALTALYDPVVALTTRERTFKTSLIGQAQITSGHRVLDLGCGTGTMAVWIKARVPGAEVMGLDGDSKVLARARAKAKAAGVAIRFDEGFSHELPYPDNTFDRVLSSLFFHHLSREDKLRTAREVFRVLRPGGEFHVADWGKAANALMRVLFYAIQILDGFPNTATNVLGGLPEVFRQAGFGNVQAGAQFSTVFGTMSLYRMVRL